MSVKISGSKKTTKIERCEKTQKNRYKILFEEESDNKDISEVDDESMHIMGLRNTADKVSKNQVEEEVITTTSHDKSFQKILANRCCELVNRVLTRLKTGGNEVSLKEIDYKYKIIEVQYTINRL